MLEKIFKLSIHGTSLKTELLAGLTTFITMAYIIFVNPQILSAAGMPAGPVMTATILSAALATILTGLLTNYPFAQASGMGLNAFFAFSVAPLIGWQGALGAVFISGVLFMVLAISGVINLIDRAVPVSLKKSIAAGIGLFIALIGFKNAGIIQADSITLVRVGDLTQSEPRLAIFGLVITAILMSRKFKGALIWGIVATTVMAMITGVCNRPDSFKELVGMPSGLMEVAFKLDFSQTLQLGIFMIFSLMFVDVFDSMGTLMGTGAKAGYLDSNGRLPKIKGAMIADSIGTMAGAVLGTSTVTTYVESTAGVSAGGRTGLTSVTVGILFLSALFLAPLAAFIQPYATAPALIVVGVLMAGAVREIDFEDFTEALPAFLTMVIMPFTFSIADGIAAGFIFYPIVKTAAGKFKVVHWFIWILAGLSVIHLFMA